MSGSIPSDGSCRVLVTGGSGFLGRAIAQRFRRARCQVVGIGHRDWEPSQAQAHGFDVWVNSDVRLAHLMKLDAQFDIVIHCAGSSTVNASLQRPLESFAKTVGTTAEVLEFVRIKAPHAVVIYPSSAAVYGKKADSPIEETALLEPLSPYGSHKLIAEQLLISYARNFHVRIGIIRFFSIYGPGLRKQLLWDASRKLLDDRSGPAVFSGTGEETRDWLNVTDAAELVWCLARIAPEQITIINGGSGIRSRNQEVLEMLRECLGVDREFTFDQVTREGDPCYLHADISRALGLAWQPKVPLKEGIGEYVRWLNSNAAEANH